jgi:hypothetical protein
VWRLTFAGAVEPWGEVEGDVVTFRAEVGDSRTDLLCVGELPDSLVARFDTFRRLMRARVGDDTDWERLQQEFALARVAGDAATARDRERRLARLAAAELTVPDRPRARGASS